MRGGVASPSPRPYVVGTGEEGTQHPATDGVSGTQHPRGRNTSLYVSPTLLVFEEPHDQDGVCALAADYTHPEGDLVWPFRRLDAAWLGWLARVVGRAGDRLSTRQQAAWETIQAWAVEHGIHPSSPPPGYRPPVPFRGSTWRYDRERTDGKQNKSVLDIQEAP